MLRTDALLIYRPDIKHNLTFVFRGKRWTVYTILLAILVFIGTHAISHMVHVQYRDILVPGGYVVGCLLCWSSISNYFTSKVLEFNPTLKRVQYQASSLFGKTEWDKDFAEYIQVRLWRPERASFIVIVLRLRDGEEIPLGTSEAGIFGVDKARTIAKHIAEILNVPMIEERTVLH